MNFWTDLIYPGIYKLRQAFGCRKIDMGGVRVVLEFSDPTAYYAVQQQLRVDVFGASPYLSGPINFEDFTITGVEVSLRKMFSGQHVFIAR